MTVLDSLTDLAKPRRGRPPKLASGLTPVQGLARAGFPKALEDAADKVDAAVRAFEGAHDALTTARSAEAKVEADAAVRVAEAKLYNAEVQAEIAERNGERDGPTADDLKELRDVLEAAKSARESFAPRIAAYKHEMERRRRLLAEALEEFAAVRRPMEQALREAVDRQLAIAANLLGEAKAAMMIEKGYDELPSGLVPKLEMVSKEGYHVGTSKIDTPPALKRAYQILRRGQDRVTSYRDPGDPM